MLADYFTDKPRKIRLLLEKDGKYSVETTACHHPDHLSLPSQRSSKAGNLPTIAISNKQVNSNSTWFYHKTTNRELYTNEFAKAVAAGCVDMIFLNDKGKLTEGCISNIFLYLDGTYVTPPIKDGLLAGVMREYLLEEGGGKIKERSLTIDDLEAAQIVCICNSVRGVTEVKLKS